MPSESLKVFDGQLEHEPGSPVEPALHVHALLLALPEGEVERDGQLEQVADPTDALYVQLVHGPPSGPLEPALHTHSDTLCAALLALRITEAGGTSRVALRIFKGV